MSQPQPVPHHQTVLPCAPAANQEASLQHARLVMCDGTRFAALTTQGTRWVTLAAGCLLQPAVGDLALISLAGSQGYILTVLERAAPASPARVAIEGDLHLSLPQGHLTLSAARGMAINSGPAMDVATGKLSAAVQDADVSCQTLHVTGAAMHTQWQTRTDIAGDRLEIATRLESHAQQCVRHVTGHEEITAQSMRHTIDRDWTVSADTADVKARERATVQAASVQLG